MRGFIAFLAVALSVWGCGASSTSGDGGGGGGGGGACPIAAGTYSTHWTYVSGGAMCMQNTPADSTDTNDGGGISGGVDAGASCPVVQNGCSFSVNCTSAIGDAGSSQVAEMITVNSDGSASGTLSYTISFSFGGQTTMEACAYSFKSTKQ